MAWYLWMLLGALVMFACFLAYGLMLERREGARALRRHRAIALQRDHAERQMQAHMQDTVSRMFEAARTQQ